MQVYSEKIREAAKRLLSENDRGETRRICPLRQANDVVGEVSELGLLRLY